MTYSDSVPELDGLTVEGKIEALELALAMIEDIDRRARQLLIEAFGEDREGLE